MTNMITMTVPLGENLQEPLGLPLLAREQADQGVFNYYADSRAGSNQHRNHDCVSVEQSGLNKVFVLMDGITHSSPHFDGAMASLVVKNSICQSLASGLSLPQCLQQAHKDLCDKLENADAISGVAIAVLGISKNGDYVWCAIGDVTLVHVASTVSMFNFGKKMVKYTILNTIDHDAYGRLTAHLGMPDTPSVRLHSGAGKLSLGQMLLGLTDGIAHENMNLKLLAKQAMHFDVEDHCDHLDVFGNYIFKEASLSAPYPDDKSMFLIHYKKVEK
jgi:hypothetical protein